MKKLCGSILIFLFLTTACSGNNENHSMDHSNEAPQMVNVEIRINPEIVETEETVTLQAYVSQGGTPVDDADDVTFELWEETQESHVKVKAKFVKDGIYQIERVVQEPGTYSVIAHVNARGMHTMPKTTFIVEAN